MDLRRVNHPVVLEAAVSVAVDFMEVVLVDSEDVEGEALQTLVINKLRGTFNICSLLPVYSDRIAREFHPIPFYPNSSWALDRLFHCLMSDLFYCKSLFLSIPVS